MRLAPSVLALAFVLLTTMVQAFDGACPFCARQKTSSSVTIIDSVRAVTYSKGRLTIPSGTSMIMTCPRRHIFSLHVVARKEVITFLWSPDMPQAEPRVAVQAQVREKELLVSSNQNFSVVFLAPDGVSSLRFRMSQDGITVEAKGDVSRSAKTAAVEIKRWLEEGYVDAERQ